MHDLFVQLLTAALPAADFGGPEPAVSDQYDIYCLTDRFFYDRPATGGAADPDFPICQKAAPAGWEHQPSDTWMYYAPVAHSLPAQGWKIHVSASLDEAERVLSAVWDYCTARMIPFKFLRSKPVMVMFNSKAAFRGSSGKLVTIYPEDENRLELMVKDLDGILAGVEGPYILSDLRVREGPVYVRYGGFAERYCLDDSGERVLALEDGAGNLVPDVRGPTFAVPEWVGLPAFLEPELAARNAVTISGLPYDIEGVLQFSNGGGVYLGRERATQRRVVLKEGRPFAGLDTDGRDAVTRLSHERDILQRLAGLEVVPELIDYFTLGDHHFLVQEFIDGNPLQRLLVHRFPLSHPDSSADDLAQYTQWAVPMLAKVEEAVAAVHERGVVFGDLHPSNILVAADERLALIDFEVSTLSEDRARSALAHPAFQPPADRLGVDGDRYALACLCLGMFAPQTTILLPLHEAKARQLADLILETFPVPPALIETALRTILGEPDDGSARPRMRELPMPGIAPWEETRAAMCRAILASATPERDDRLFPGDAAQFQPGGGLNLATGAAGVLYALTVTGAGRFPEHEDWLRKRALDAAREIRPGFFDGRHGIAYVLDLLGHRQEALDALEPGLGTEINGIEERGLCSGLAGIGLNLLHFAAITGDSAFATQASRIVDQAADRLGGPDDVPEISGGDFPHAGLMFGSAGSALLFLQAYELHHDPALLDLAEIALRQDLRRCVRVEDGTVQVNQDWRTLPYLDEGSIGIALVLQRYLAHRPDAELSGLLTGMLSVTRCGFSVQAGLFAGRSSMIAGSGMAGLSADPELVKGLRWHALPYGDGLAFPGNQLLRLSMDLATGTAGVLLALGTVLHDRPVHLPFLQPAGTAGNPRRRGPHELRKEV